MKLLWIPFALLSAFFGALVAICTKKCLSCGPCDLVLLTALNAFIGASLLVSIALCTGKAKFLCGFDKQTSWYILLAGLAGGLSTLSYFFAISKAQIEYIPAVDAFSRMSAIFALIFTFFLFDAQLTIYTIFGALFIIIGAALLAIR